MKNRILRAFCASMLEAQFRKLYPEYSDNDLKDLILCEVAQYSEKELKGYYERMLERSFDVDYQALYN